MNDRIQLRVKVTRLICLTGLIGSTGCGFALNRGALPPQHYVLGGGPSQADATPSGDLAELSIGLRRPQIASYLDAPFIVVRRGLNQIGFSELHRWGEDLGGGISRAVAGDLSERASFRTVDIAPWAPSERYDYLVQLHVLRFEGLASEDGEPLEGEAQLLATWEILSQEDGSVLTRGTTDYREGGWRVGDYAGLVTLLDAGLGVLSDDLVAAIGELTRSGP
jgi:hypothetical protein